MTGTWQDEATFHATEIVPRQSRRPGSPAVVQGRVVALSELELVVGTQRGPLAVAISAKTHYSAPGLDSAGPSDLSDGDPILVRGTWTEGGVLDAPHIRVLTG